MTDRPIIFSAPMVRALLEGRKTQTRRMLKMSGRRPDFLGPRGCEADPTCWGWETAEGYFITVEGDEKDHAPGWRNGWQDWRGAYAPGDRLWVREGFRFIAGTGSHNWDGAYCYRADGAVMYGRMYTAEEWGSVDPANLWRSPIHMPRWASRLTLTVTDVRVQRVQEISAADAIAEGIAPAANSMTIDCDTPNPRDSFARLWNSIHGPGAWDANPWVCALTFTVRKENIDHD